MNPEFMIRKLWSLAWEVSYLTPVDSVWVYHSNSQNSESEAERILDRAMNQVSASPSTQEKVKSKTVGVFSQTEFNEIVEVFRLLQKWRDEAKARPQNIEE